MTSQEIAEQQIALASHIQEIMSVADLTFESSLMLSILNTQLLLMEFIRDVKDMKEVSLGGRGGYGGDGR